MYKQSASFGITFGTQILLNPSTQNCQQISQTKRTQKHRSVTPQNRVIIEKSTTSVSESTKEILIKLYGVDEYSIEEKIKSLCAKIEWYHQDEIAIKSSAPEIIKIINTGNPENRIDVVFMGDGYTLDERDRFEEDIRRLVDDMWNGSTFATVLPLFNIWAIFDPSQESGIGIGGVPRNTSFGLYRDGSELRGIYASKRKYTRQVCNLVGEYACDYPSLIGNDDFYGGLGGEFVISTRSKTSGTVVLRHEIGHSMVVEGEEYDGGQVYQGPNASKSLKTIKWTPWLTEPDNLRVEENSLLVQDYSWYDLSKGEYVLSFDSKGESTSTKIQISASGVEFDDTLEVYLDGKRLEWKSSKTLDRAFYTWNFPTGFTKGQHKISFKQGYPKSTSSAPIRQLCNVVLLEYPDSFRKNLDFVGAYPTRDINGKVSYRPTDDNCLMRNMERENFCPVCVEGLWLNLLKRISLIDGFKQNCNRIKNTVEVFPLKLGQFRVGADNNKDNKDLIIIKWFRKGKEVKKYRNENIITLDQSTVGEKWFVVVIFETPEIRQKSDLLISKQEFVVCI